MVEWHCTHCGDIVRKVTVYVVRVTPIRATFYTRYESRHLTRRVRPGFQPDVTTRPRILRRNARRIRRIGEYDRIV